MRNLKVITSIASLALVLNACTEPGETTAIGATAGGAVGAGLGAIVGSQTGSAGGGLVVGALLGSAGGAAVGNAVEYQEEELNRHDEAIRKQQLEMRKNQQMLLELQRIRQADGDIRAGISQNQVYANRPSNSTGSSATAPSTSVPSSMPSITSSAITASAIRVPTDSAITERKIDNSANQAFNFAPKAEVHSIQDASKGQEGRGTTNISTRVVTTVEPPLFAEPLSAETSLQQKSQGVIESNTLVQPPTSKDSRDLYAAIPKEIPMANLATSECKQAQEEVSQADVATDLADRLFRMRRALRLCPQNPDYHVKLGEVYLKLSRPDDAEHEFKEAIRLDPNHSQAQALLKKSVRY